MKDMKKTLLGALALAAFSVCAMAQPAAAPPPPPGKKVIRHRQRNQQKRIAQGVRSGQLTPGEAARLERKQAKVNREVRRDLRRNGGKLTPAERARITREQNKASREIAREKHDAQHQ
jgi:Spy/CpxP family protein refolding chaperone